TPMIVPPQVAIVGAGVIREQVVAAGGEMAVHPVLPISVTIDHRVVTGGEAAGFLTARVDDRRAPESPDQMAWMRLRPAALARYMRLSASSSSPLELSIRS